jgi:glycosyltransferase involved in cell wall biosynthesis
MRVLFVAAQFPQDFSRSVSGGLQRIRMWLDAIRSLGADLEILFFHGEAVATGSESAAALAQQLRESWGVRSHVVLCAREAEPEQRPSRSLASYFQAYVRPALALSPHLRLYQGKRQTDAFARCLDRSPDIVLFHRFHTTAPASASSLAGARVLFDIDDLAHRRFAREIAQPPRWRLKPLLYLQVPVLWWGERRAIVRSSRAFVCSETDRRYLWRTMGVRNVAVIPNAVARVEDGLVSGEPNILFLGAYSYPPNAVAAEYLIHEVWPRIASRCPKARLLIAGLDSDALTSFHHPSPGVEFLGFVSDLGALYRRTRVVCCPIQSGSGTRFKILEAASYGVPVVSTPIGAEGIDLVPDAEIVLRSSATDLAEACLDLLRDDLRARSVGASARERVRALYSRDVVVRRMRGVLTGDDAVDEWDGPDRRSEQGV